MHWLLAMVIGLSLSADCFAVSTCLAARKIKKSGFFLIPLHFGFFQGAMALIGYFLGSEFISLIADFDHWVAFALLGFVGGKMIKEFFDNDECAAVNSEAELLMLSVATSIDALVVGLALGSEAEGILLSAGIIGAVTVVMSWLGLRIGKRFEGLRYFELVGGVVLIGIGIKTLIEHIFG